MKPDDPHFDDDATLDEAALDALLGDPGLLADPDLWADPDPADADAIVAMIAAERGPIVLEETGADLADTAPAREIAPASETAPVVDLGAARAERSARRGLGPMLLSAAAGALVALLALTAIRTATGGDDVVEVAGTALVLEGTELAPSATADANVVVGRLGTRIDLDVSGLEPAPEGFYYEAWLRQSPEVGVSAGTFHLRGGDGSVELWAGVDPADYPLLTVTLQPETLAESSGQVVLKGRLDG